MGKRLEPPSVRGPWERSRPPWAPLDHCPLTLCELANTLSALDGTELAHARHRFAGGTRSSQKQGGVRAPLERTVCRSSEHETPGWY